MLVYVGVNIVLITCFRVGKRRESWRCEKHCKALQAQPVSRNVNRKQGDLMTIMALQEILEKKLLGTSASLLVTSALLVVTRS